MIKSDVTNKFWHSVKWLLGGVVLGFLVSKYSVQPAYQAGYYTAKERYAKHYTHQIKAFYEYRNQSCMRLWFNDKQGDLNAARMWMCQYTNRDGSMK